jgi:acetoin utilization protein AcuB
MTTELITVSPYDTLETVSELFSENNFHHLIVIEDNKLVGIVSNTDLERAKHGKSLFINKSEEGFEEALLKSIYVGSIMSVNVSALQNTDTLQTAYQQFKENAFRCLPVNNETGKLVGLITPIDLLDYAFK